MVPVQLFGQRYRNYYLILKGVFATPYRGAFIPELRDVLKSSRGSVANDKIRIEVCVFWESGKSVTRAFLFPSFCSSKWILMIVILSALIGMVWTFRGKIRVCWIISFLQLLVSDDCINHLKHNVIVRDTNFMSII